MTTNTRDTILRYLVETTGDKQLIALANEVLALGDASGKAEGELNGLLSELERSTRAGKAVQTYADLRKQLELTRAELTSAKAGAAALFKQFDEGDRSSAAVTRQFAQARKAIADLESAERKQLVQLQALRGGLSGLGVDYRQLGTAQAQLAARSAAAADGVARLAAGLRATRSAEQEFVTATREAAAQQARLEQANRTSAEALQRLRAQAKPAASDVRQLGTAAQSSSGFMSSLRGAIAGVTGALSLRAAVDGAVNILKIGDAAQKTRIQLANLFGGESSGNRAFEQLRTLSRQTGTEFDGLRDSAVRLKAFGLDPLDGTLKGLIDLNAKLGGSQETLQGIVLAVGQAWSKQKLQGEEILQLVERGVPVWDLLAKATGKNVLELQKLSTQGKLGRDTIRLLLDEISKSSSGASAKNLGLLSTQFAQLQDRVKQFFAQVAQSGALKFFSDQIAALSARIDALARDGSLARYARQVSDALISVGKAVASVAGFIRDHASQIADLAKVYAAVKVTQFVSGLASMATALAASATQAKVASAALLGTGGAVSRLSGLTLALRSNLLLAGAALATFGTAKFGEAVAGISEELARNSQAARDEAASLDRVQSQLRDQIDALRSIQEQTVSYRNTRVLAAAEVAKLSADEVASYRAQIAAAQRYNEAQIGILARQREIVGANEEIDASTAAATKRAQELRDAYVSIGDGIDQAVRAIETGLTKGAQAAADRVQSLIDGAKDAAKSLQGLFDGVDFGKAAQLEDLANGLSFVAAQSETAARSISQGLGAALDKLDGTQLLRFQSAAEAAFDAGGQSAQRLASVLNTTLQASLRRLGVDANTAGVEVTDAGKQMIAAFTAVAENAQATGQQIRAAFVKAVDSAATEGEVKRLKIALEQAFDAGKISATEYGAANSLVVAKLAELKRAAIDASGGFSAIGQSAQQGAQQAIQALENLRSQAAAKAQDIAQRLAAALSSGANADSISALRQSYAAADADVAALNDQIDKSTAALKAQGDASKAASADVQAGAQAATQAVQETGAATEAAVQQTGGAAAGFRAAIEGAIAAFRAQSEAAAELFKAISAAEFKAFYGVQQFQTKLRRSIEETQAQIDAQKFQAEGLASVFEDFAARGVDANGRVAGALGLSSEQALQFAANVRAGNTALDLLGQQDLEALAASAERAAQRIKSIEDQAKSARDQLANLGNSLQDELDRAAGNDEAIAQRRFEEQLAQIDALAKAGGNAAAQDAARARQLAEKSFQDEIARIRQRRAEEQAASDQRVNNINRESEASRSAQSVTTQQQSQQGGVAIGNQPLTVNVNINGGVVTDNLEALARKIEPQFKTLAALRR